MNHFELKKQCLNLGWKLYKVKAIKKPQYNYNGYEITLAKMLNTNTISGQFSTTIDGNSYKDILNHFYNINNNI